MWCAENNWLTDRWRYIIIAWDVGRLNDVLLERSILEDSNQRTRKRPAAGSSFGQPKSHTTETAEYWHAILSVRWNTLTIRPSFFFFFARQSQQGTVTAHRLQEGGGVWGQGVGVSGWEGSPDNEKRKVLWQWLLTVKMTPIPSMTLTWRRSAPSPLWQSLKAS